MLGVHDLELVPLPLPTMMGAKRKKKKKKKGLRRTASADWSVWKGLWALWCGYVWEVLASELANESELSGELSGGFSSKLPSEIRGSSSIKKPFSSPAIIGPKLATLDLHGSLMRVVRAGCGSLVGVWGVCVRETKFSVVLVDSKLQVRRVGKMGVVFGVEVPLPEWRRSETMGGNEAMEGSEAKGESLATGEKGSEVAEEESGNGVVDLDEFLAGRGRRRILVEFSGSALLCRPADRATRKFKGRKFDGF